MAEDMYEQLDATSHARLVATREASPQELAEAAIARIEASNPAINAVTHCCFELGLAQAKNVVDDASVGPLAGVPFLLKGLGATQVGVPTTRGNIALERAGYVAPADTPLGERFRASGLATLGVTNLPEFALLLDTQPLAYGPTRNPWNLERSASGSSGGAAAAVAARMVPIAHANDAGGSIRLPACWCGVVGLKPSRGRVPRPIGRIDDIFGTELVVSRTVRDTALALDCVEGALVGELYALPRPGLSYSEQIRRSAPRLRIGVLAAGPAMAPLSSDCRTAIEQTAAILQHAGHELVDDWPAALFDEAPEWVDESSRSTGFHRVIDELAELLGRPVTEDDVEPFVWYHYMNTPSPTMLDLLRPLQWQLQWASRILEWWEGRVDLLLAPVLNEAAVPLTELTGEPNAMRKTERRYAVFTEAFNITGQPAISVPTYWTEDGLPLGVQLIAKPGREDLLLRVAAQLEEATAWPDRCPPAPRE